MYNILRNSRAGGGAKMSDLTPDISDNISLFLLYAVFGVGFPLVFMFLIRRIRKFVIR